ncbi:MAG: hypothetical protein DKT66_11015 [Candidatus Melainabacteria bacterium]|nr:MAG: hypothetical protein DKT66_11015 [Candidatus Melainabacteria bacterium]
MNKRYIKAILIGAAFGLATLLSWATCHSLTAFTFAGIPMHYIPFWDTHSSAYRHVRPDLQAAAVLLRFCMLLLHNGYNYLLPPILVCCLIAKLEDLKDSNIVGVAFRRALKATGLILLVLWLIGMSAFAIIARDSLSPYLSWDIIPLAALEFIGIIAVSIAEELTLSVTMGISPVIFAATFIWHYCAAQQEWSKKITQVQSDCADVHQK